MIHLKNWWLNLEYIALEPKFDNVQMQIFFENFDQRTYQRGAEKTTYLPQELDAGLWIPWPSPLLEVVHVEKACVQACPGPPKLAPLHEVVVGELDVLLAAPSRGPEPRAVQ